LLLQNRFKKINLINKIIVFSWSLGASGSIGAINGTSCDSGKTCLNRQCVNNPQAPKGNCLYGDDLVMSINIGNVTSFPTPLMSCSAVIQLLISNNFDPVW